MNVRKALQVAREFVIWGEPNGDWFSYEPLKATYDDEEGVWVVKCRYTTGDEPRTAIVEIDDESEEIVGFEVLEG